MTGKLKIVGVVLSQALDSNQEGLMMKTMIAAAVMMSVALAAAACMVAEATAPVSRTHTYTGGTVVIPASVDTYYASGLLHDNIADAEGVCPTGHDVKKVTTGIPREQRWVSPQLLYHGSIKGHTGFIHNGLVLINGQDGAEDLAGAPLETGSVSGTSSVTCEGDDGDPTYTASVPWRIDVTGDDSLVPDIAKLYGFYMRDPVNDALASRISAQETVVVENRVSNQRALNTMLGRSYVNATAIATNLRDVNTGLVNLASTLEAGE